MRAEIESEIESPCTGVCRLDDTQICIGCLRTIDEIIAWPAAATTARLTILQNIAERRGKIKA